MTILELLASAMLREVQNVGDTKRRVQQRANPGLLSTVQNVITNFFLAAPSEPASDPAPQESEQQDDPDYWDPRQDDGEMEELTPEEQAAETQRQRERELEQLHDPDFWD